MRQSSSASPPAPGDIPRFSIGAEMRENLLLLAGMMLFLVYGAFRQRFIWGVDSFGYFEFGKLLSEGRVFLPLDIPSRAAEALVPWGFRLNALQQAVPEYPPGYPLLLSIGHLLRAPTWVNPVCGVVSCALLFGLLQRRASTGTALLLTAGWAVMPLTVYGSTMLMSDLVAATALMGGLLAFQTGRPALSAWILGFAITVRPTNVLFLLPFVLLLDADRKTLRFLLHLSAPCLLYAAYNTWLFGAPWRTGYGNVSTVLTSDVFPRFLPFFAATTWTLLTPIIVLFAAAALLRPNRERVFLVLWALGLAVFYSFWSGGGTDRWWWARFLLPAYPAIFLLAGDGAEAAKGWLARRFGGGRWPALCVLAALLAVPALNLKFGLAQNDLWQRTTGEPNRQLVGAIEGAIPPGSLVGSLEHASSLKLYTKLIPFVCVHPKAPELVDETLARGLKVYLLPEPWQMDQPVVRELFRRFEAREVARYHSPWPDLRLFELHRR